MPWRKLKSRYCEGLNYSLGLEDLISDKPWDGASRRDLPQMHVERFHEPNQQAMLAALRNVLGLPRVLPNNGQLAI